MSDNLRRVSPEEAHQLVTEGGYVYLDVRTETEWAGGHPEGSHNVPFMISAPGGMKPNEDFVAVMQKLYEKNCPIVLGCGSGVRSLKAANALISVGYTAIVDQRAGFQGARDAFGKVTEPGWGPKGLPVEKETPGCSYAELKAKAAASSTD